MFATPGPADWVTGQLSQAEVRRYARGLLATTLLLKALADHPDGAAPLQRLGSNALGARLLRLAANGVEHHVPRTLLEEALLLCRDDEPLLDLLVDVHHLTEVLLRTSDAHMRTIGMQTAGVLTGQGLDEQRNARPPGPA